MRYRKLKFKPEYLTQLITGRKKTTIRMERKYTLGETVYIADTNGRIYGKAVVDNIVEKELSRLTEEDAIVDGFNSLDELLRALGEIYGELPPDQKIYIYHLKILRWRDQALSSSQRK